MYLQGGAIWHPRCGPGPTENGQILNGAGEPNGHCTDTDASVREFDRMSSSGVSEMQVFDSVSLLFPKFCFFFRWSASVVVLFFAWYFTVLHALSHP